MFWRVIQILGLIVVLIAISGPLGSKFDVWNYNIGFAMLSVSLILAIFGLVAAAIGLVLALRRKESQRLFGLLFSGLLCGVTLGYLGSHTMRMFEYPPINDVTTDLVNPPQFFVTCHPDIGCKSSNPRPINPKFAELQDKHYPDIVSWVAPTTRQQMVPIAAKAMQKIGLDATRDSLINRKKDGVILGQSQLEAEATSFWFGFVDDVVVRITNDETTNQKTVVDIRSTSRVGVADLGVNAERIRALLNEIKARSTNQ